MLRPQITEVKPLTNYALYLRYNTNEQRIFDVSPYIGGEWFGKLQDRRYFETVRVSGNTVEWQGGQDIAPHELYDCSVPLYPRTKTSSKIFPCFREWATDSQDEK